jgi:hypothetical protein
VLHYLFPLNLHKRMPKSQDLIAAYMTTYAIYFPLMTKLIKHHVELKSNNLYSTKRFIRISLSILTESK